MILQAELYRDLNPNVILPIVLPLTCDSPDDIFNYRQCNVENPCWIGDGYCDFKTVGGYYTEEYHPNHSSCPEMIDNGKCGSDLELLDECDNKIAVMTLMIHILKMMGAILHILFFYLLLGW